MIKKLPENYYLYELSYQNNVPSSQLFVHFFNSLPSRLVMSESFGVDIVDFLLKNDFKIYVKSVVKSKRINKKTEEILLINDKDNIMVEITSKQTDNKDVLFTVVIYYDFIKNNVSGIINEIVEKFSIIEKKSDIKLLKNESGFLDTEDFSLNIPEVDIKLNYGEHFLKVHNRIVESLNKFRTSGIVLLHGDPGTGKTTYIKFLTSLINEKDVIFIPPSTAESLSEPAIIPFLMDHKDSVLIIEDAEKVISDRETGGSSVGVSNILNLTDGILGDCLNIQIIATFNMKKEKIDKALLRKGRLIAEHKFSDLSIEESNILLEHIGKTSRVTKPTSLADIYNIDVEEFKESDKKVIGFKS